MLQHLRKKAGLKQGEMAERLGVNNRTYGAWERGEAMINLAQACACADVLGCSVDELAGRSWPPRNTAEEPQDDLLARELVERYEALSADGRVNLLGVARGLSSLPEWRAGDERHPLQAQGAA